MISTSIRGTKVMLQTAHMHHTYLILDKKYVPTSASVIALFREMQTLLYAVLQVHLKTDRGQFLVCQ
jgi:hypothetical protein